MDSWIVLTLLYSIFNGFFECCKKKSLEKNSIYEFLACFSLMSFLMVACTSNNVFQIQLNYLFIILIKSIIIVFAWLLSLYAIKKMPLSLYGVINVSKIVFTILLSMVFFGERLKLITTIGIVIVIIGLVAMNRIANKNDNKKTSLKAIIALLACCLLSSFSAIIDKSVLTSITSAQLQFWFLLFLAIIYWLILLIKNKEFNYKSTANNYWIPITAICLVVGDRFLFMANKIPESSVSIMTIIKQISTIEVIILGKILFKEKNIIKKLLCSILVIFGIVLTVI